MFDALVTLNKGIIPGFAPARGRGPSTKPHRPHRPLRPHWPHRPLRPPKGTIKDPFPIQTLPPFLTYNPSKDQIHSIIESLLSSRTSPKPIHKTTTKDQFSSGPFRSDEELSVESSAKEVPNEGIL